MNIKTVVDKQRGCGWRTAGGIYLRSDGLSYSCGKLPLPLKVCPCCHGGIKPSRGWTWVNAKALFKRKKCKFDAAIQAGALPEKMCITCPLKNPPEQAGLIWIGEAFYATPKDFIDEAMVLGVSRRLSQLPHGLVVGKTMVLVAHRKAIKERDGTYTPAIFHAFFPTSVEYVVRGDETEKELERIAKRGMTPVKVVRDGYFPQMEDLK